jgi:AraC-like DNA-binding protein
MRHGHVDLEPLDDLGVARRFPSSGSSPDRVVFDSGLVRIGCFRESPHHHRFRDAGPIVEPIFAFQRTTILLQYAGSRPFPASSSIVTYYNVGQVYWRRPIDPAGDQCEWFSLRPDVLRDVMSHLDPAVNDHPERPFRFERGPGDARAYLLQRAIVRHVVGERSAADALAVEESVVHVLQRVARLAVARVPAEVAIKPAHRDLAERVRELLGRCFHENLSLAELAASVGCSPFYLARVFRAVDGRSIHQYRLQQRLTRSLERVAMAEDLGAVGLDLGFSSHSHFTAAFRRGFGMTPSQFRREANGSLLRSLLPAQPVPLAVSLAAPAAPATF